MNRTLGVLKILWTYIQRSGPKIFLGGCVTIALISEGQAGKGPLPHAPSALEVSRLPHFCAVRYSNGKNGRMDEYKMWGQRFGKQNWSHMHHYCNALYFMNRARFETDKANRRHYLNVANSNLDYILARWSPSFQLSANARSLKLQVQTMQRQ